MNNINDKNIEVNCVLLYSILKYLEDENNDLHNLVERYNDIHNSISVPKNYKISNRIQEYDNNILSLCDKIINKFNINKTYIKDLNEITEKIRCYI